MFRISRPHPVTGRLLLPTLMAAAVLVSAGCGRRNPAAGPSSAAPSHAAAPPADGVLAIPESVRRTLGITFARAELRNVEATLRLAGHFEPATGARRDYAPPVAGHVELHVALGTEVTTGQPLFSVSSPDLREKWTAWSASRAKVASTSAALILALATREGSEQATSFSQSRAGASQRHKESLRRAVDAARTEFEVLTRLQERFGGKVVELTEARTRYANAQAALRQAEEETLDTERDLLRLSTEGAGSFGSVEYLNALLEARRAEHAAAVEEARNIDQTLRALQAQAGGPSIEASPAPDLLHLGGSDLGTLEFRSMTAGIVRNLAVHTGAWVEPEATVLSVVAPRHVVFRAAVPQSDALRLQPEMAAWILHPDSPADSSRLPARWGGVVDSDPRRRVQEILYLPASEAGWALAGVGTFAEVVVQGTQEEQICVPAAAITVDGIEPVLFLRDRDNPDKVRRVPADCGLSNGRWTVLESGVGVDDEVVLGGLHQLKLATQGQKAAVGHFHADGTWHEGEH